MTLSIATLTLLERTLCAAAALTPLVIGLYKGASGYFGIRRRGRALMNAARSPFPRSSAAA